MMEPAYITICVVDDDPIHRVAFKHVIGQSEIASTKYCEHIPADHCLFNPDLIMINMDMIDYCATLRLYELLNQFPEVPIICYSLQVDVNRYIHKHYDSRLIHLALEEVIQNLSDYVNNLTECSAMKNEHNGNKLAPSDYGYDHLSSRELEVFSLLGKGHGILEIANVLEIKRSTIESHIKTLRHKLKLNTTLEIKYKALAFAKSKSCIAFSNSEDHMCPHRGCSVGECGFIRSA